MKPKSPTLEITAPSELDRRSAGLWKRSIPSRCAGTCPHLHVDLSRTRFIDSSGVAALLDLNDEISSRGGELWIVDPSPVVAQFLNLTRVNRLLRVRVGSHAATPNRTEERSILVVEDEPHIRAVAELVMRPLKRTVLTADNGLTALEIARREKPAVIVLDYIIPVMDGMETLRELKADPATRDIPVVIISANQGIARGMRERFEGASVLLTKPFSPSVLRGEVERLLGAPGTANTQALAA